MVERRLCAVFRDLLSAGSPLSKRNGDPAAVPPPIPEPSGKCLALRGQRTCIWPQASLSKLQASSFIKRFLYISYGNIHVKRLCFYTIATNLKIYVKKILFTTQLKLTKFLRPVLKRNGRLTRRKPWGNPWQSNG